MVSSMRSRYFSREIMLIWHLEESFYQPRKLYQMNCTGYEVSFGSTNKFTQEPINAMWVIERFSLLLFWFGEKAKCKQLKQNLNGTLIKSVPFDNHFICTAALNWAKENSMRDRNTRWWSFGCEFWLRPMGMAKIVQPKQQHKLHVHDWIRFTKINWCAR